MPVTGAVWVTAQEAIFVMLKTSWINTINTYEVTHKKNYQQ